VLHTVAGLTEAAAGCGPRRCDGPVELSAVDEAAEQLQFEAVGAVGGPVSQRVDRAGTDVEQAAQGERATVAGGGGQLNGGCERAVVVAFLESGVQLRPLLLIGQGDLDRLQLTAAGRVDWVV
jgi:hypothetical protein